ncbi:MAG TPA: aspartate aminotransferase family protein [Pseudomonadales bacterium]|nr:aspartate aminotransferase family protein [Pseudomonadales bacterium]
MDPKSIMPTYKRLDVEFTHGEGVWLYDTGGRRYLDALAGIAVCGLGHAHPAVTRAIQAQAAQLLHTSNVYGITRQRELAERLAALSGMDNVFFGNSGAEANECAIKIARMYGHGRGVDRPSIVVMENSFHGRTLATLSATGSRKVQAGFEPLVSGFVRARYGDLDELQNIARNNTSIVAVLLEPIQGESGVRVAPAGYLEGVRELCDRNGWLMMLDEVQTGNGRTGRLFAFQHTSVMPDVLTTAKGLGNGVPIGACLAHGAAAGVFHAGNHGSTFGGNPLACATALSVLDTIVADDLCANAERMGTRLMDGLRTRLAGLQSVVEVRGRGLMVGIELREPCTELMSAALARGLLINVTADSVIRLLPPLIIGAAEIDQIVATLGELIEAREHACANPG